MIFTIYIQVFSLIMPVAFLSTFPYTVINANVSVEMRKKDSYEI